MNENNPAITALRRGTRLRAGMVLESGEPREVHHFATLIGYGAEAVHPWLALAAVREGIARMEKITGRVFGDTNRPLLLSVRSGARASRPGCTGE